MIASAAWLVGYVRAIWPLAVDSLPRGEIDFFTYPQIRIYRVAGPTPETLSERRLQWFNLADGPTGVEYSEAFFPCWVVSLGALAGLITSSYALSITTRFDQKAR
jgi:hypothetical protein